MKSAKEIALAYMDRVWNKKDMHAVDAFLDEEVVIHSLLGDFYGRKAMKDVIQAWLRAFPDLKVAITSVVCENDMAAIQWKAEGTHQGEFRDRKPTGKAVSYTGVTLYRIQSGKIVDYWAYLDMQHLIGQISGS